MKKFAHIAREMFVYLKPTAPASGCIIAEPLRSLEVKFNRHTVLQLDHIMSRRIVPRECFGISENKALIYYVPIDLTWNFSSIDTACIYLHFAPECSQREYDVVVVARVHNKLCITGGMSGLKWL